MSIWSSSRGGAELALAVGLAHPDIYGTVLAASPGAGLHPPAVLPRLIPRAYLVAGTYEPFFLDHAKRWATALRDVGADVISTERVGAHRRRVSGKKCSR